MRNSPCRIAETMAASELVHDDAVRHFFADGGIIWHNAALEGGDPVASAIEFVANRIYSQLLKERYCGRVSPPTGGDVVGWVQAQVARFKLHILVVLDNVSKPEVVTALSSCGVRLFVTTREQAVATAGGATPIEVNCVDEDTARHMLANAAQLDGALPPEAELVLKACAGLPLTLSGKKGWPVRHLLPIPPFLGLSWRRSGKRSSETAFRRATRCSTPKRPGTPHSLPWCS